MRKKPTQKKAAKPAAVVKVAKPAKPAAQPRPVWSVRLESKVDALTRELSRLGGQVEAALSRVPQTQPERAGPAATGPVEVSPAEPAPPPAPGGVTVNGIAEAAEREAAQARETAVESGEQQPDEA